ncbi:YtxH domain-containing protein [Pricia sp. S334]|uniref:YtxH domain-containing protein n=1 Tax=Pricia mediterranea TaxID=3076079 RepID=A0ABU3L139_9FLAO|nr:YtxH domain-containing protein [Pricia sp. S334]MDT7827436.1 YtxH domain-containing protein [Pricia sp. S334]
MDKNSNIGLALITGAALGAAFSILYAPARGVETRQRIIDSTESAADALLRAADQLKNSATNVVVEKKGNLEAQLNSVFSRTAHEQDELIALLEQKLDSLKKKGRKINKKAAKA